MSQDLFSSSGNATVILSSDRRLEIDPPAASKRGASLRTLLETELENLQRRFRSERGWKRKDFHFETPEESSAVLSTPEFEYRVHADWENNEQVVQHHEVEFKHLDTLRYGSWDPLFHESFDSIEVRLRQKLDIPALIDRLEEQGVGGDSLDYDLKGTWCEVAMKGTPLLVRIEPQAIYLRRKPGFDLSLDERIQMLFTADLFTSTLPQVRLPVL